MTTPKLKKENDAVLVSFTPRALSFPPPCLSLAWHTCTDRLLTLLSRSLTGRTAHNYVGDRRTGNGNSSPLRSDPSVGRRAGFSAGAEHRIYGMGASSPSVPTECGSRAVNRQPDSPRVRRCRRADRVWRCRGAIRPLGADAPSINRGGTWREPRTQLGVGSG